MEREEIVKTAEQFDIEGKIIDIKIMQSGNINKTYVVKYDTGRNYVLQYVNTNVFKNITELMKNIELVTEYIKSKGKGQTLKFITTKQDKSSYVYNGNWRMYEFIGNTKTYISTESLEILKEAGKAVGDFQKQLDGFDAKKLYEIIPKFH